MQDVIAFLLRWFIFPGLCLWAILSGYRDVQKLRYAINNRVTDDLRKFGKELVELYRSRRLYLSMYCLMALISVGSSVWYINLVQGAQLTLSILRIVVGACAAIFAIFLLITALELYIDDRVDKQAVMNSIYIPYVLQKASYSLWLATAMIMIIVSPWP